MPHIYIHSQSLLQGSATMMFSTATVILNTFAGSTGAHMGFGSGFWWAVWGLGWVPARSSAVLSFPVST
jgi:hypothetical protein